MTTHRPSAISSRFTPQHHDHTCGCQGRRVNATALLDRRHLAVVSLVVSPHAESSAPQSDAHCDSALDLDDVYPVVAPLVARLDELRPMLKFRPATVPADQRGQDGLLQSLPRLITLTR